MNKDLKQILVGNWHCFLAACDEGQPHVCPFAALLPERERLYFRTEKNQSVSRWLRANPRLALCLTQKDRWLSIEGSAVLDDDRALLREFPEAERGAEPELWYLRNGAATLFSPGEPPKSWKL